MAVFLILLLCRHPTSSASAAEVMSVLFFHVMKYSSELCVWVREYTCRCMVKCRLCRIHWVPLIRVKVKGSHRKPSAVHLASWWPALTILEHVMYPQYKCSRMLIGISFPRFASLEFLSHSLIFFLLPLSTCSREAETCLKWSLRTLKGIDSRHFLFLLQVWIISQDAPRTIR